MSTNNDNYSFYLFCKLRDVILPSDEVYDLLYSEDLNMFFDYQESHFNSELEGEYECMVHYLNFIKNNKLNYTP